MMQSCTIVRHSDLHVVETCLQSDLDSVADWLDSSRLRLNVEKSNCMLIGSRQRVANKGLGISVGGNMLTQVNSVRYLGVLIDPVLSWTLHINRMVSRVRSRLRFLQLFIKFMGHCLLQCCVCCTRLL